MPGFQKGIRNGKDAHLLYHGRLRWNGGDGSLIYAIQEEIAANTWLPDKELNVYVHEYQRTGFQGGLNWYRVAQGGYQRIS